MIRYYLPKLPAVSICKFERPVTGWKASLSLKDGLGNVIAEINTQDHNPRDIVSMLKGPMLGYVDSESATYEMLPVFLTLAEDTLVIEDFGTLVSVKEIKTLIELIK